MFQVFVGDKGIATRRGGTCVRGLEGLEDVVVVWSCLVCFLDRSCCFTVISIVGLLASSAFLLNLPIPAYR